MRAVTISTTAVTIEAPATTVVHPIGSFRNTVPSATAMTGLTKAYVATTEMRTFFNSHAYAENAISDPTATRYAKAIRGLVAKELACTSFACPAASICIDAESNGLLGNGAPRA